LESKTDIVKKILQAAKAVNKKQLRSLNFGFDRLLPKIQPEFAAIGLSVPLSDMIKKYEPNHLHWGKAQSRAFDALKSCHEIA